jgi:hypothetical protein
MADPPMTVVETEEFLRKAKPLMSETEREELVAFLGANPEAGKIVADTGGVRRSAGDWPEEVSAAARG